MHLDMHGMSFEPRNNTAAHVIARERLTMQNQITKAQLLEGIEQVTRMVLENLHDDLFQNPLADSDVAQDIAALTRAYDVVNLYISEQIPLLSTDPQYVYNLKG